MTPAEAAQERAQGGGRLQPMAEDGLGPARSEGVRVIDAVAPSES